MAAHDDLHQKVSQNMLERLLEIHGEANNLDFKQSYSLKTSREKAELVRDMLSFANTEGGGHIIYGVDKTFEPIGLPEDVPLDTTEIYKVLQNYSEKVNFMAAEYDLQRPGLPGKRRFGILYIAEASIPVMPLKQVAYQEEGNRAQKILINEGDIFVRRGAQSIKADQETVYRLLRKKSLTNEADVKVNLRKRWRGLETLQYALLSDSANSRSHFIGDLAYSLNQIFAIKGYTKFISLLRLRKGNSEEQEFPIYELISHQVEFCEAIRQRATKFISNVLSIKESNLDIEDKNKLKDMMKKEMLREHEAFFSRWKIYAKVAFTSEWSALELIYDPPTASITLHSVEEVSINPSNYPERVHTTSDLLRYIASLQLIAVGYMGLIEWYADNYPLMKLMAEVLDKRSFQMDRIRININDYEEWDYDNGAFDEEAGRYKPQ